MVLTDSDLEITACLMTDAGRQREENQDAVCYVRPGDPSELRRRGVLAVVADGMGGHRGGRVASTLAVDAIRTHFLEADPEAPEALLEGAFERANDAVYRAAAREPSLLGMGTTATALLLRRDEAFVAHVGDSRAYRCSAGGIDRLTEDDTLVRALVRDGTMTEESARRHPERNVLVKALGTRPGVRAAIGARIAPIQPGDTFVLCSDGLHELVEDHEIARSAASRSAEQVCRSLLALALSRGATDNVSVVVLTVERRLGPRAVPITREIPGALRC